MDSESETMTHTTMDNYLSAEQTSPVNEHSETYIPHTTNFSASNISFGFIIFLSLLSVMFNIIIIFSIKYWQKLGKTMAMLLKILACNDILMAVAMITRGIFIFCKVNDMYSCVIILSFLTWSFDNVESVLLLIAIENCISARNIARHQSANITPASQNEDTRRKVFQVVVVASWLFWAGFTLWGALDISDVSATIQCYIGNIFKMHYIISLNAMVLAFVPCIVIFHLITLTTIKTKILQLDANHSLTGVRKWLGYVEKITKITIRICVVFVLTWCPVSFYVIGCYIFNSEPRLYSVVSLPMIANLISNICVYMARSRDFRLAVKAVFCGPRQNAVIGV